MMGAAGVQGPWIGSSDQAFRGEANGTSPGPLPRLSIRRVRNRVVGDRRYLSVLLAAAVRRSSATQPRWRAGQDARVATRRMASEPRWSRRREAMSRTQPDSRKESDPKHLAAVTRSLQSADEAAEHEDHADALGWLHAVEGGRRRAPAWLRDQASPVAASGRRESITRLRFVRGGSQFRCERLRRVISELSSLRPEHQTEDPLVDDRALPPLHGAWRDPGEVVLLRAARSRAVPRRLHAACRAARRHRDQSDRLDRRSEPAPDTGLAMSACGPSLPLLPAVNFQLQLVQIALLEPPWIPVPPTGDGEIEASPICCARRS